MNAPSTSRSISNSRPERLSLIKARELFQTLDSDSDGYAFGNEEDYVSFRSPTDGSKFIQAVCSILEQHWRR